MATLIGDPILDSAGQPANGTLLARQSSRYSTDSGLITQTVAILRVDNGRVFKADSDEPPEFPGTPTGQAVEFVEDFRDGTSRTRTVTIPAGTNQVKYGELPDVDPVDDSGIYAVPSWAAEALAARDLAVSAKNDAENARDAAATAAGSIHKGEANGVAGLGADTRVPQAQLPAHLTPASLAAAYVAFGSVDPSTHLPAGTEYVWNKTDGAGTLLDIVSGVA